MNRPKGESGRKTRGATRRDFLKLAATGAPAAAAAAVIAPEAVSAGGDEAPRAGLRETAHVRAYYATARF